MFSSPKGLTSTPEVMHHIQTVIRETSTPSWFRSVPYNFGEARAGTLKADEWHSLATVYLPLALISLWGEGSEHPSDAVAVQLRRILDNTMALISAIRIACSRRMTQSRIAAYHECITTWLHTLNEVLPDAPAGPNGHMACHITDYL